MKIILETITPTLAQSYLDTMGPNRAPTRSRVRLYASEMLAGKWRLTHQAIAFNCDGSLRDGQHRLLAIVLSGKTQQMYVARGLNNEALKFIDTHKARTDADAFAIDGHILGHNEVAVAKALWSEYCNQRWGYSWGNASACDRETLFDFINFHAEAIEFSKPGSSCKGLSHACVRAAIASAYWTRNHERLAAFREQLQSGVVESTAKDGAVIRLRDWLLTSGVTRGGSNQRQEVFGRCCTALLAYLEERNLTKLYNRKDATFKLPVKEDWLPASLIISEMEK